MKAADNQLKENALKYKIWREQNKKAKCIICGEPTLIKYCSDKCRGIGMEGERNLKWTGGPKKYDIKWNNRFKKMIRERDGNRCMICDMSGGEFTRALDVHHIDGDSQNTIKKNCISLCQRHHLIVEKNGDKKYIFWQPKFQRMLSKLYRYKYE